MFRLRWFHAFVVLALLEVVVILFSLELHRQTFRNVGRLAEAMTRFKERDRWFDRAEQCVLELNAPGNEVFASQDPVRERASLQQAQRKIAVMYESATTHQLNTDRLRHTVDSMNATAGEVFGHFEHSRASGASVETQRGAIANATAAMSRMDALQMQAMREIGFIKEQSGGDLKDLIDEFEAELQSRVVYERYFIGSFFLLLVGILWFGYRLQAVHQALEIERRRVEEERRERLAAIGELCSSVAHGIRNPLAAIRSSTQLTLQLGQLDENSRSRLNDILAEGGRLGDRVTGLLNMSRVNRSGFELIPLASIVDTAVHGLRPELERLGLALIIDLAANGIVVFGDRRHIEQAVIELVSNAIEHSPPGASIRVSVCDSKRAGYVDVVVHDGGMGVPEDVRSKIFDLFFTTKESGTGIGLATVKRIARLHGGDVTLSNGSTVDGACFVLTFPTASPDKAAVSRDATDGVV
ncbi:MAG: HAMP domain-containing sensor histidine kinase [Planctomycetota bacterium]